MSELAFQSDGVDSLKIDETASNATEQLIANSHLLALAAAVTHDGILITDASERIILMNAAAEQLCGYTINEMIGQRPSKYFQGPDTDPATRALLRQAIDKGEPVSVEIINYHRNRSSYWLQLHITPVRKSSGEITHFIAIQTNVTARKNAELELKSQSDFLEKISYAMPVQIYVYDLIERRTVFLNRSKATTFGYSADEVIAMGSDVISQLIHPDDLPRYGAHLENLADQPDGAVANLEFRGRHRNGEWITLHCRNTVFTRLPDGRVSQVLGTIQDVSELAISRRRLLELNVQLEQTNKALAELSVQLNDRASAAEIQARELAESRAELYHTNQRLELLASTDGLTGLKNHRIFQEVLRTEYSAAVSSRAPLSLMIMDVDSFKSYNDRYGHPEGDDVLRRIASMLPLCVRNQDTCARYGGEEFAVILPGAAVEEARVLAERIRTTIAEADWRLVNVTISIGVAELVGEIASPSQLVTAADQALYHAKQSGRNRVAVFGDISSDELHETRVNASIEAAYSECLHEIVLQKESDLMETMGETDDSLIETYDATITAWAGVLELRDRETEGHSQRVTNLTVQLARFVGMNEEEVLFVKWGALLHDIGKLGIPDAILHKPGDLTSEEYATMRKHPVLAYEMLRHIAFIKPAIDIPYSHHEKWDGTGYPQGLRGEAIPIAARLFAVVDVWDALRSDRPYRRAWGVEKVLDYLRANSGSHFDPRAVSAFIAMIEASQASAAA